MKTNGSFFNNCLDHFFRCTATMVLLFLSITVQAQDKEFKVLYANGKVYREGKFASSYCGTIVRESTFDLNGNLLRRVDWKDKKRCGTTIIYSNGKPAKEIVFHENVVKSYIAYKSGRIYTQISEDRKTIISKGKLISANWKRIYIPFGKDKLVYANKNQFIDILSLLLVPEVVAQSMAELSKDFEDKKVPGDDAVVNCGGKTSALRGATVSPQSSDPAQKSATSDLNTNVQNTCAANSSASLTSSFGGKTGPAARKERVANARAALDKMIASCESNPKSGTDGMFSSDKNLPQAPKPSIWSQIGTVFGGAAATVGAEIAETVEDIAEAVSEPATEEGEPVNDNATSGEAIVDGAFVAVGAATVITVVLFAPEIAAGISTLKGLQLAGAAGAAVIGVIGGSSGAGAPGGTTPGGTSSMPSDMESGSSCERMRALKTYCDGVDWRHPKCEDFARVFSGCRGSVKEMYLSSEGDVSGVSCPPSMSAEDIARADCERKGMFAMPRPGGTVCRTNGGSNMAIPAPTKDPQWTDPVPYGDLAATFSSTAIKVALSGSALSTLVAAAKKPTMVVIMNPNCSSCKSFSQTLKSPTVQSAMTDVEVIVVDGTLAMEVTIANKVTAYPSFFTIKDGKKSTLNVGTLGVAETAQFLRNTR